MKINIKMGKSHGNKIKLVIRIRYHSKILFKIGLQVVSFHVFCNFLKRFFGISVISEITYMFFFCL